MAQQVKVLATEPEDLSFILKIHRADGESQLKYANFIIKNKNT